MPVTRRPTAEGRSAELESLLNFGTWRVDLTTGELWWSTQMRRICGVGATEAPPDVAGYAELVHRGDRDRVFAELSGLLVGGEPFDSRHRLVGGEGTVRHVRAIGRAERDIDGALVAVHGTTQDLSDLVATEARGMQARQRLGLVLANLPGSLVALYDRQLCVRDVEGADPEAVDPTWQGEHVSTFLTAEGYATLAPVLRGALDGTRGAGDYEHPDGRVFHVEAAPFIEDGELTGVLSVWHEVTEQRRAEQARRDADQLFRSAFDHAPIGMVMVGLDGGFLRSNTAISDITGYGPEELSQLPPFSFVHPDEQADVQAAFSGVGVTSDTACFEHRIMRTDGRVAWVQAHAALMRDARGQPAYVLSQVIDVTARQVAEQALRESEERLRHLADHDALTGLANRRRLEAALSEHLARCERYGPEGAVLLLDIDHFKTVNDTEGHAAGDQLLKDVADVLRRDLRDSDTLARLGGDEFAVLLPKADSRQAIRVAAKLVGAVRDIGATISVGAVASERLDRFTVDEALAKADHAMYNAKTAGRDRFRAVLATARTSR